MIPFYELKSAPVHSVLLLRSREEALNYPAADISLGFCDRCMFISNVVFNADLHEYSTKYEATQAYSSTFNAFHKELAKSLIERFDLHKKNIIEIGCGQGEFLHLLCELGDNHGVGFDPAYDKRRSEFVSDNMHTFIRDFYSEKYKDFHGDFVCCKMTLEHIPNTLEFVTGIRAIIGKHSDTIVFFQIPNVTRILQEMAFWDIYYEHCSYFSEDSLRYLFVKSGFDVIDLWRAYDDQYLMIAARPDIDYSAPEGLSQKSKKMSIRIRRKPDEKSGCETNQGFLDNSSSAEKMRHRIDYFSKNHLKVVNSWREKINELKQQGKRIVIWGAGSKGVAFLTTLKIQDEIDYAVDINPNKHGTYMAGTGQQIVAPDFLREYRPDVVIVMNPIYCQEIKHELEKMDIDATILPVS